MMCRKTRLANANPGPCHLCRGRHLRRLKLEKGKEYAILVPNGGVDAQAE